MPNQAVLFCSHVFDPMIEGEISRLRAELPDFAHRMVGYLKEDAPGVGPGPDRIMYRREDLAALPYPEKIARVNWNDSVGNNDLPVLAFYREHPGYDFYWLIEYDVRYTGAWSDLFAELGRSDADLLGTTLQDHDENPRWHWWSTLVDVPEQKPLPRTRAFLPFCRMSNRALTAIDRWYGDGGAGHPEVIWPGVCKSHGFKVEDIGGAGRYTPADRQGKHYFNSPQHPSLSPGTFVWRPSFQHALIAERGLAYAGRPMLWHPIKA